MTAKCPDSYFSPEPCQWGEWQKGKQCDVCKEEAKGLTKYAIRIRPLKKEFIYPDVEGFWKGTAKQIGKGPECYSHDKKENYAAKKESWEKILEDYEETVSFIETQFTLGLAANLGLPT